MSDKNILTMFGADEVMTADEPHLNDILDKKNVGQLAQLAWALKQIEARAQWCREWVDAERVLRRGEDDDGN